MADHNININIPDATDEQKGLMTAAQAGKLDGIETGADVTDSDNVGASIHGAVEKTTPVDADTVGLIDSAASNVLKKLSWSNIKATLKAYFDTLYSNAGALFQILTGRVIWVDAVNGDDGTGTAYRQDLPFATPEAALAAAASGDLIYVRPGNYTTSTPLNFVGGDVTRWHLENGAVIEMDAEDGAIFDDTVREMIVHVTGAGKFVRSGSITGYGNVIRMTDALSEVYAKVDHLDCQVAGTGPGSAAIYHANGHLSLDFRAIDSVGEAYYWVAGGAYLNGRDHLISSGVHAVYCIAPDGNTDEVYIRVPKILASGVQGIGVYTALGSGSPVTSGFRLWVVAETIGGRAGIQHAAGKGYYTAQKIYTTHSAGVAVDANGHTHADQCYVTTQKIGVADTLTEIESDFAAIRYDKGLTRIECQEIDLSGITTSTAVSLIRGMSDADEVDFELRGANFKASAAIDCTVVTGPAATGRRAFVSCTFDNTAATTPDPMVVLTDSVTVLKSTTLIADGVAIDAASALSVECEGAVVRSGTIDSDVTVVGDLFRLSTPTEGYVATVNADGSWSWATDARYKPVQVTGLTLTDSSWSLVGSYYEYDLADANITASSIVEVIPDNADIDIVIAAEVLPRTDSSAGSVKLYAVNAPTDDIGVTLNIHFL